MWIHQTGDLYECSECGAIEHVSQRWMFCPVCGKRTVFACDPSKNKSCGKMGCYMVGGPCEATFYKDYCRDKEEE